MTTFQFVLLHWYLAPMWGVYLFGIVAALLSWRRHPPVSGLLAGAFGLLLFCSLLDVGPSYWTFVVAEATEEVGAAVSLLRPGLALLRGVAFLGLLAAALGWRRPLEEQGVPTLDRPL